MGMQRIKLGILLWIIGINLLAQGPPSNQGYKLLYEENFEGKELNTNDWAYRVGRRKAGTRINGLNLKENVYVKDGVLYIEAKHEKIKGKDENTGGGIISKINFGYGYYESLSKPYMAGKGVHTSFWQHKSLRNNNNIFEIDGYEIDSKSKMACNNLYVNHKTKEARTPWPHRAVMPYVTDNDGWILDAWEYTPNGVIFYDGGKIAAKAEWKDLTAQQAVWLTALNGCGKVDTAALPGKSLFKYFRYYAKDYPGVNLLPNGNFEYNQDAINSKLPVSWTPIKGKNAIKIVEGNAAKDQYKLRLGSENDFNVSIHQKVEMIRNGNYMLTAQVRSNLKSGSAQILVNGEKYVIQIPKTKKWKRVELKGININDNQADIKILAQGDAFEWLEVDDINFMKPPLEGKEPSVEEPFKVVKDPIWELAKSEPIKFTGADNFFFFDRFVGYGDAISIAFTLKVDELGNMTPISRLPKTGKSGWSIGLVNDGSLIFRIGSKADYTDVIVEDAYSVGQPCNIVCQFDKGRASVYLNGKLLKSQKGINQNTLDKTTAGKLGSVGSGYEAVSAVIHETGKKSQGKSKNFKGSLQNVKVYNRALF